MTDFRALCAELLQGLDENRHPEVRYPGHLRIIMDRARTLLAQPEPAGEVGDLNQLSDGYHTFAELYEHRHALMLAFMRAAPDLCWFSRRHADGELCFGSGEWFIVGAELPDSGTVTYHLPMRLWGPAELTGAAELERGRPWDGHTAKDVVQRLTEWATGASKAQPVPVSERLPGLDDCDAEGRCWWEFAGSDEFGPSWTLVKMHGIPSDMTRWLPVWVHALPTPTTPPEAKS